LLEEHALDDAMEIERLHIKKIVATKQCECKSKKLYYAKEETCKQ
jgi:hypothetical protein